MRIPNPCLSVCLSVCPHPEKRNHHSFVNISPALVIDTSMERSSRVLHHGETQKFDFFFQKSSKFEFWLLTKSWNHLKLRQYQSYISNWYINLKVFTSTTPWKSTNMIFFSKKFEIEFCPYPDFPYTEKRNRPDFVDISPTFVIDTSMERFLRVLQHGNQKLIFFQKSLKLNFTCAEELKSIFK